MFRPYRCVEISKRLKGQFTPKLNKQIFPLTCTAIYPRRLFWCEISVKETSAFSLLCNGNKAPGLYSEIMIHLLRINNRSCCEQFHVGTILLLPNYTHHVYHLAEGSWAALRF